MAEINLNSITKESTTEKTIQLNITTETDMRKLMQHLSHLDFRWGSGDKPNDFVPSATFRPITIWLDAGIIYYDSGTSPEGNTLVTFTPRGRKKRYPRVPVPNTDAKVYATASLGGLCSDRTYSTLKARDLLHINAHKKYKVQLLPFTPGRTIYAGASLAELNFLGEKDGYFVYVLNHDAQIHVDHKGKVLRGPTSAWEGIQTYCIPKIAAVFAARMAVIKGEWVFNPAEFDGYFKSVGLLRYNGYIFTPEKGVEERTKYRINDGVYFDLPKTFPKRIGTGVHLSTMDDKLLAYYPTTRHILDDIPQRIKPGRYLKKYFPDMHDDDVRLHSAKIIAGSGLKTFSSSEDMIRIYLELKNSGVVESCMSKDRWDRHPLDAYHESDVELAVMYEFGEPKARALYNKHNKHFPMIYGQWEKMQQLLEQNGFKHATLCGAKINKIVIGHNRILMPYIDSKRPLTRTENKSTYVDVFDDHCVISDDGKYNANRYDEGYIYVDGVGDREDMCECGNCGDDYPDGDGYYVEYDNMTVCDYCHDNDVVEVYRYGRSNTISAIHSTNFIYIDGEYYADSSAAEYHDFRFVDDEWRHIDDLIFVEGMDEYVTGDKENITVFYIFDMYYSLDWILSNVYVDEDGDDITKSITPYPISEARTHFQCKPLGVSQALWDALPEPTSEPSAEAA